MSDKSKRTTKAEAAVRKALARYSDEDLQSDFLAQMALGWLDHTPAPRAPRGSRPQRAPRLALSDVIAAERARIGRS